MKIFFTSRFEKAYRKLPYFLKNKAKQKETVFRNNPFDKQLKTHKLGGKYNNYWSFSISGSHRIMFEFIDKNEVAFINIGDHDIYN